VLTDRYFPIGKLKCFRKDSALLNEFEKQLAGFFENKKVVVMGVGQPLRGDDALGVKFAERLGNCENIKSIVCEELPENFTGTVREENPDVVLFVDAIDFGANPGDLAIFESHMLTEDRFSSHRPSLKLVMDFIKHDINAEVRLLGIQPQSLQYSASLSCEIDDTLNHIVKLFKKLTQKGKEENA
jgi:hydrogenase 3 maturation protease